MFIAEGDPSTISLREIASGTAQDDSVGRLRKPLRMTVKLITYYLLLITSYSYPSATVKLSEIPPLT